MHVSLKVVALRRNDWTDDPTVPLVDICSPMRIF